MEWKRFVGEDSELSFRHIALEAPSPGKMLNIKLEIRTQDCGEKQIEI